MKSRRRERLTAVPELTAKRLYREIKEQDYKGSYTLVRAFVHSGAAGAGQAL